MGNSRENADSRYGVYVQPADRKIGISGTHGGDFSYISGAADGGLTLGVSGSDWVTVTASGQATMATSGTGYALKLENESSNGELLRLVSGDGVTMYIQSDHIYNSSALHIGNSQNIYLRGGKIGVNTTGPWSDLSVSGDMGATGWVSGTSVSGTTVYGDSASFLGDVTLTSATSNKPTLMIKNTNTDGGAGELQFYKSTTSEGDGDAVGRINFYADNDAAQKTQYARIRAISQDMSDGTEDGRFEFSAMQGGTLTGLMEVGYDGNGNSLNLYTEGSGNTGLGALHAPDNANFYLVFGSDLSYNEPVSGDRVEPPMIFRSGSPNPNVDSGGDSQLFIQSQDDLILMSGRYSINGGGNDIVLKTSEAAHNATTERMRIVGDGKVGIGNSSPNSKLTVQGDLDIPAGSRFRAGCGASGVHTGVDIYYNTDGSSAHHTDSVIETRSAGGDLVFRNLDHGQGYQFYAEDAGGTENFIMGLDGANQRVGIGTTSPDANLHVSGSYDRSIPYFKITSGSSTKEAFFVSGSGDGGVWVGRNMDESVMKFDNDNRIYFRLDGDNILDLDENDGIVTINSSNKDIDFQVDGDTNDGIFFVDGGNERVGIGTTSPTEFFHVKHASTNTLALFESGDGNAQIRLKDSSSTQYVQSDGSMLSMGPNSGYNNGNLNVIAGGKVGIGTTEPANLLTVSGNASPVKLFGTSNGKVEFDVSTSGDFTIDADDDIRLDAGGQDIVLMGAGSEFGRLTNSSQDFIIQNTQNDKDIIFKTVDNTSATEVMRIDGSESMVGIGTTGPSNKLDVLDASNPQIRLSYDGSNYVTHQYTSAGNYKIITAGGNRYVDLESNYLNLGTGQDVDIRLQFNANTNVGYQLWDEDNARFDFYKGSDSPTLSIDTANARVGIGTTGPAEKLSVVGGNLLLGTNAKYIQFVNNGGTQFDALGYDGNNDLVLNTPSDIIFKRNGTENVRIKSNDDFAVNTDTFYVDKSEGTVGINTNAPSDLLTVQSDGNASVQFGMYAYSSTDDKTAKLFLNKSANSTAGSHTAVADNDVLGLLAFRGSDGDSFEIGAQIRGQATQDFAAGARGTDLIFSTVDNSTTALDDRMVILQDGKVGIGKSDPQELLDINGDMVADAINSNGLITAGGGLSCAGGVVTTPGLTIGGVATTDIKISTDSASTSDADLVTAGYVDAHAGGGGSGANTALSNLSSVAINTSLVSDTDNTDDLGSASKYWKDIYFKGNLTTSVGNGVTQNVDVVVGVALLPAGPPGEYTLDVTTAQMQFTDGVLTRVVT
jgi:hypothetical protein